MTEAVKTPHDLALAAFNAADAKYTELEESWLLGTFFEDLAGLPVEEQKTQYAVLVGMVKKALEERNVALKTAQDELRQKVTLNITKQRGPEGAGTVLTAGPFKTTSVTFRAFNTDDLVRLCKENGIYERLLDLKQLGKDGKEEKLVQQVMEVDYPGVYAWLKGNGFQKIIDVAYDEKEGTPQVKGPKVLAFLGDKKAEK
jgi:hypothetical protein